jgi:hypothetical protein
MWDVDRFPGAEHVPWQLLIRARYAHELDAGDVGRGRLRRLVVRDAVAATLAPEAARRVRRPQRPDRGLVIEQALRMVRVGGIDAVQKSLGEVRAEVGGLRG